MIAASFALLVRALGAPTRAPSAALASLPKDREAACSGDNPYLATVCYRGGASPGILARQPAVVAFRDTASGVPQYQLASQEQVGAVYGLAYSPREAALYAAAFHKRQVPFGPAGPGAVYRIDLATGDVVTAFTVPNAGVDRHSAGPDRAAGAFAGKTSLGDMELSADGTELYVVNLEDRRIYRFRLPDGRLLGSFAHGASGETWAADARPFGLGVWHDRLFHTVVCTAEASAKRADLLVRVYESGPDGSGMRMVAQSTLDYGRGRLNPRPQTGDPEVSADWLPWSDRPSNLVRGTSFAFVHPMPMASDVVFSGTGNLIVGLRDRTVDMMSVFAGDSLADTNKTDFYGYGAGDLVRGVASGDGWRLDTSPEFFQDNVTFNDETTLGGLAALGTTDSIVANGWGDADYQSDTLWGEVPSAFWFDAGGGAKVRSEPVCRAFGPQPRLALPRVGRALADNEGPQFAGSTGDVEVLCGDVVAATATESPQPTPTSTATRLPSTTATPSPIAPPSASASRTTQPTSTPTSTPSPLPRFLPLLVREHCDPERKRADVALVIDTSSSMAGQKLEDAKAAAAAFVGQMDLAAGRDQVAVVRYDSEAEVVCRLTHARAVIEAAIRNLSSRTGTHIDAGLRTALAELESPRHVERNLSAMVLLTDGRQTGTPGEELRAATEVRAASVRLYTIGLGADVDAATLGAMAGDDRRYHFAPDSAALRRIYEEIASDIQCPMPAGGFWPGR